MAEFKFLESARVKASDIISDARVYISRVYGRAGELFTTASPFAQIMNVVSELTELIMFYIEDATVEQNIMTAQQSESVYGLARLTGHDPARGFSAVGEIEVDGSLVSRMMLPVMLFTFQQIHNLDQI